MKVSVIGTGYVGLVSGTCFAEFGHDVTCIDIDESKIKMLKEGQVPIYEPGLTDLIRKNVEAGRLHFSTDYESVKEAQSIFLAVGTPSADDGRANLTYLEEAAKAVAKELKDDAIVVIKSTVPVGTSAHISKIIAENTFKPFHLVSNPEFLKEGSAVDDFMKPDRVIIGHRDEYAAEVMEELYAPLMLQGNPIYKMSNLSAEMSKYAANCFLATKISFINEIAKLCDASGADIEEVRKGITSDRRIGPHFLYPGPGYGGSCFPKDVKALIGTAKDYQLELKVVQASEDVNAEQKTYMFHKINKHFDGELAGKTFAFWGVAFKPNTDDVRETPAKDMVENLVGAGATVKFFDPVAGPNFMKYLSAEAAEKTQMVDDKDACLENTDALVLMTEWREFRAPEYDLIAEHLRAKVVFDTRNLLSKSKLKERGLSYYSIGRRID